MTVDNRDYHELFVTPVKVTIKYPLTENQRPKNIKVYYLGSEGQEKMDFEYIDGFIVFYLPHMSLYSIEHVDDGHSAEEFDYALVAIAVAACAAVDAGARIIHSRKS